MKKNIIELTHDFLLRKYVKNCRSFAEGEKYDEDFLKEIESRLPNDIVISSIFRKSVAHISRMNNPDMSEVQLAIKLYVQECPDVIYERVDGKYRYRRITDPWTPSMDQ